MKKRLAIRVLQAVHVTHCLLEPLINLWGLNENTGASTSEVCLRQGHQHSKPRGLGV
jgi:hypothetical protein